MDHINKAITDLGIEIDTDIQNITCLGMMMFICNKQHLINI